jgi:hypothetical protein
MFGKHSPWLREWIMYSGVGVGIPKGLFTIHDESGPIADLTPLEAADLERYPKITHYYFSGLIGQAADLARFAEPLCSGLPQGQWVSFSGYVGTRQGWAKMRMDDVCAADGASI